MDAQICLLSWVSFGLEPASDGSRRLHLSSVATSSRLGSSSTTTPSTSTVTSGTVGRPHQRPARCRTPRAGPEGAYVPARAGGYSPAWGARSTASGGSQLFTGTWPGGSAEASLGSRAAWAAASVVRAGARCAPLAGGISWNCRPGRGTLRPVRRRSHGDASRRPGRVGRCDCRPGGGRRTLFAGAVISPSVGRRAARYT